MDFESWIQTVNNCTDPATLSSLFDEFKLTVDKTQNIDYFDLRKLLEPFKHGLTKVVDDNQSVVLEALASFIRYAEHDIELYIKGTLAYVISCFLDYKVAIKKAARYCLQMYLVKTRNIDDVVSEYVRIGLLSKNVGFG